MTITTVDAKRLHELYNRYIDPKQDKSIPLRRQILWWFWLSIRRRAQDEYAALCTENTETRQRARLLREIVREISEILQARTETDRVNGQALESYNKTHKAIRHSQEIWHLTASIGFSIFREMRADFCVLEPAVLASHPAAKPYRKFYHEFKEALNTISDLLCDEEKIH